MSKVVYLSIYYQLGHIEVKCLDVITVNGHIIAINKVTEVLKAAIEGLASQQCLCKVGTIVVKDVIEGATPGPKPHAASLKAILTCMVPGL